MQNNEQEVVFGKKGGGTKIQIAAVLKKQPDVVIKRTNEYWLVAGQLRNHMLCIPYKSKRNKEELYMPSNEMFDRPQANNEIVLFWSDKAIIRNEWGDFFFCEMDSNCAEIGEPVESQYLNPLDDLAENEKREILEKVGA